MEGPRAPSYQAVLQGEVELLMSQVLQLLQEFRVLRVIWLFVCNDFGSLRKGSVERGELGADPPSQEPGPTSQSRISAQLNIKLDPISWVRC